MKSCKICWLVFCFAACASHALPDEMDEHVRRVEDGLLPAVLIKGIPGQKTSLADRMAFHRVPGVSIAVIDKGQIAWARGYGVLEAGGQRPVDSETLFQAASISKPVSTLAALALVDRGTLSLDENVNDWLVSWKVPENELTRQEKVTLRRLLSHSAGLTVHGFAGYAAGEPVPTLKEVLEGSGAANSKAVEVDMLPGKQWRYSGGGFCVLQQLLVDVEKKPFPDTMDELVLWPLAMRHSTFQQPLPDSLAATAATGHWGTGGPVVGRWHTYPELAAAGLWTTPSDLARFAMALQTTGQSNLVLSAEMTQQMLTPQIGTCGLGIGVDGTGRNRNFSHSGATVGFRSMLFAYTDTGKGAVVMVNSDSGILLIDEILRAVAREYDWPDYRPNEATPLGIDAKMIAACTGRYQLFPRYVLAFSGGEGRLFVQGTGDPKAEAYRLSETEYFSPLADTRYEFTTNLQGQVVGLMVDHLLSAARINDAKTPAAQTSH